MSEFTTRANIQNFKAQLLTSSESHPSLAVERRKTDSRQTARRSSLHFDRLGESTYMRAQNARA